MAVKQTVVGFTWKCETSGHIWTVTEMVRPGLYRVVRSDKRRIGEMHANTIQVLMKKHGRS